MTSSKDEFNGYVKGLKEKERNSSYSLTEREGFGAAASTALANGRKSKRSASNNLISGKNPDAKTTARKSVLKKMAK